MKTSDIAPSKLRSIFELWHTSTQFRLLIVTIPFTVVVLALSIPNASGLVIVSPIVLLWKLILLGLLFRRAVAHKHVKHSYQAHFIPVAVNFCVLTVLTVFYVVFAAVDVGRGALEVAASCVAVVDAACLAAVVYAVLRMDEREWGCGGSTDVHTKVFSNSCSAVPAGHNDPKLPSVGV